MPEFRTRHDFNAEFESNDFAEYARQHFDTHKRASVDRLSAQLCAGQEQRQQHFVT